MTTNKDPWKITADDRRKHNVEFLKLNPAGGYLTGAQAKTFLLHSGLPPAVLGQIWELADIDSDGRMSEHEFSVAVHLIQLKLDKHDLPKILPSSMKVSPLQSAPSATHNAGSMGGFNKPPTMSGTTPAVSATPQPTIRPTMPMSSSLGSLSMTSQSFNTMSQPSIRPPMGQPLAQPIMQPMSQPLGQPFSQPLGNSSSVFGSTPSMVAPSMNGFAAPGFGGGAPNVAPVVPGGFIKPPHPSAPPSSVPTNIPPPDKNKQITPSVNNAGGKKDLAIPQPMKLKYTQMFNKHDKSRKGYLSGMEARAILTQSNLTHNLLAQIWSLSDLDSDGKLTTEEFTLAMHLVELVRSGQTLPAKLPPELIPPAYRRQGGATSAQGNKGAVNKPPVMPTNVPSQPVNNITGMPGAAPKSDSFGDLLGGLSMPTTAPPLLPEPQVEPPPQAGGASVDIDVTFEDKRRENFTKGQAELEKRRAQLREQQKKENEERLAAEAAEQEKREKLRLEQEQKKQQALLKQQEKQRKIEQEKEEIRQKALEQRESARRELERNRQLEWERQRREQLVTERQKHQNQVEALEAQVSKYRLELETLDNKKLELSNKITAARTGVTDITSSINSMRTLRDVKITDIDRCNKDVQDYGYKFNACQKDRLQFDAQLQSQANSQTDTFRSVKHSHNSRQDSITKLKTQITKIEDEQNTKRTISDTSKEDYNKLAESLREEQEAMSKLKSDLQNKQQKWNEMSQTQVYSAKSTPATSVSEPPASESHKLDSSKFAKFENLFATEGPPKSPPTSAPKKPPTWMTSDSSGFDSGGGGSLFGSFTPSGSSGTTSTTIDAWGPTSSSATNDAWGTTTTAPVADAWGTSSQPPSTTSLGDTWKTAPSKSPPAKEDSNAPHSSWGFGSAVTKKDLTHGLVVPSKGKFNRSTSSEVELKNLWAGSSADTSAGLMDNSTSSQSNSSTWATSYFNDNKDMESVSDSTVRPGYQLYTALYQFDARNADELSIHPGVNVWVKDDQTGVEESWLIGALDDGTEGWFPEAYVELVGTPAATTAQPVEAIPQTVVEPAAAVVVTSPTSDSLHNGESSTSMLSTSEQSSFTAVPASGPSPIPGKSTVVEEGVTAEALYPWLAKKDNHLTFNKGDIILLKEQQDMWASGELNGKVGWFPKSYVKILGEETVKNGNTENTNGTSGSVSSATNDTDTLNEYYVASFSYSSSEPGDLSFNQGDSILVIKKDGAWWTGIIGDTTGIFPANYVTEPSTEEPTSVTSPTNNKNNELTMAFDPSAVDTSAYTTSTYDQSESYDQAQSTYTESAPPPELTYTPTSTSDSQQYNLEENIYSNDSNDYAEASPGNEGSGTDDAIYANIDTIESTDGFSLQPEPTTAKKPEIATVIAGYTSSGPEQLDLVKGQLIQIRKRSESGWWEGELQARGQKRKIGWFPANYVKVLGAGSSARSTPDVTRNKSPAVSTTPTIQESAPQAVVPQAAVPQAVTPEPASVESQPQEALEQVVAQFPYVSQMPDELSFDKGSIITVYSHNDDSWWKGELNGAQGVFPSNYVVPLSEAPAELLQSSQSCDSISSMGGGLAGGDYKRQIAITELIDTEETFMADMDIVLDVFYKPLKNEKVLTEEELTRIFVNWKELMIVNTKLLQALRVRKRTVGDGQPINMIGDLLCENLPHMTPYIRFCSCQLNAAALLQHKTETSQKFKDVCQNCCRDPRTKGLPVSSFLLKPMQRITKYPLMLQKIIKYTPEDHSDYQNMQDALSKANLICEQVNEGVREKENSDKLEWIQSHIICDNLPEKVTFNSVTNCLGPRKFVYSGTLCKAKSGKELYGFLFNDFFLLTTPSRPQAGQQIFKKDSKPITFKMYRAPIFLNEVMVVKKNQEQDSDSTLLHVNHIDRVYSLKASNKSERDTWIKHLDIASKTFLESERTKREKIHSERRKNVGRLHVVVVRGNKLMARNASVRVSNHGCGRLMVIILEGHNLIASDENGKSDPYCEVSMGAQENKTKIVNNTLNPKWNSSMQFTIKDPKEDVLCITVFDRDLFTPNDFLGRTEIRICDIQKDNKAKKGPITKKLPLYETESGEVSVKLDLQLYEAS